MLKYYVLLFLILGIGLYYVFLQDPCNRQLRTDFSNKYPSYTIAFSRTEEGSPDSVHCHAFYRKPDSEQTYEEIWLYQNLGSGWKFSRILETPKREQTP